MEFTPGYDAQPAAAEQPPKSLLRRRARLMASLVVLLILMGFNMAIGSGKIRFEKVTSESMLPTLEVGDVLLCDGGAAAARYAIIILDDPLEEEGRLVKRVIGMPGDEILIDGGVLYIRKLGDRKFREEYSTLIIGNKMYQSDGRWKVGSDEIFVMGDNRNNSADSRDFGPVPLGTVRGLVVRVFWPLSRWHKPAVMEES